MEKPYGTVTEPQRELPVSEECDVLVCGGGIAGVAAALAAARTGARTLLLEREYMPGGLATLGLVTIYLPLCDGEGHQVSTGIAEELLRLSVVHGMEQSALPTAWLTPQGAVPAATRCSIIPTPLLLPPSSCCCRRGCGCCTARWPCRRCCRMIGSRA